MKIHKALRTTGGNTGSLRIILKFFVALGVNNNHGFIAQNGLGDHRIKASGFSGTGCADN